jgi:uncharacterized protein (DUF1697 family)
MPKGYTTKQALQNYTLQEISSTFAGQIDAWIESVEKYIDQVTGRNFKADTEAGERVYDGNGEREMAIDDCIAIDKVEINDEEVAEEDYLLYPANSEVKNRLRLKNRAIISKGEQNVTITANWGYSAEVPADITLAATILLAGITAYSDNTKGKVRSETIGRYSVTYTTEQGWQDFERVKGILNFYKKYNLNPC